MIAGLMKRPRNLPMLATNCLVMKKICTWPPWQRGHLPKHNKKSQRSRPNKLMIKSTMQTRHCTRPCNNLKSETTNWKQVNSLELAHQMSRTTRSLLRSISQCNHFQCSSKCFLPRNNPQWNHQLNHTRWLFPQVSKATNRREERVQAQFLRNN